MIRMGFCSALLGVLSVCSPLSAEGPAAGGKVIELEIVLATASVPAEGAVTAEGPAGKAMLEQIEAWSKGGKLTHLTRIKVYTLEDNPAEFQFLEVVPIITGTTVSAGARGGPPMKQPQFVQQEAGTHFSAKSRVEEGGTILVYLTAEQSYFAPMASKPEPADENRYFTPQVKRKLQTGLTTIRLKDGVPAVVRGFTSTTVDGTTHSVVLLTAHVQQP